MDEYGIDLWISPAAPGPAPKGLESTGDPVMNLPWTHAGLPALNLPSGRNADGLPLGLQLTGHWHADEMLLAWAAGIEQVISGG
jgi:Asp-tRNA(Asn)/Glu-tRNA(Gln) amidotransferase A subunit family amidase